MMFIAPIRTEKMVQKINTENSLVFRVVLEADKKALKKEFEKIFNVKVKSIRTFITSAGKKNAIIKLQKGFSADDVAAKMKMVA